MSKIEFESNNLGRYCNSTNSWFSDCTQSIDTLDLRAFRYGGANFTGLQLVDPHALQVQAARREWARLKWAQLARAPSSPTDQVNLLFLHLRVCHCRYFYMKPLLAIRVEYQQETWKLETRNSVQQP